MEITVAAVSYVTIKRESILISGICFCVSSYEETHFFELYVGDLMQRLFTDERNDC